ncbi:MAG: segregation/condensation protein A [Nanoarchaeota archaeon]|mgnify:CR=1 FL=1
MTDENIKNEGKPKNNVKQEQIHDLLFSRELGWQEIIYDLINTEQLDPWDINIIVLSDRYLKKIQELEEADFFVSSKVLLAAALLLRLKSEILLNKYIRSIDEILFGKKAPDPKRILERIELDEEIPELIPRSPIPRMRKVTIKELMDSLNQAISTENRRIKKEIINQNALRETAISMPKGKFSIKNKIKEIYLRLTTHLDEKKKQKVSYTDLIGTDREEKIISFLPLLQLESQKKIWLDQEAHFHEIYIWLKDVYFQNNPDPFAGLRHEIERELEELEGAEEFEENQENSKDSKEIEKRIKKLSKDFENPLAEMFE